MQIMLQLILYFLPAYVANVMPILVKSISFLDIPVDFGKKLSDRPIFGSNKTYRGIVFGVFFGTVTALLSDQFFSQYGNALLSGFLLSLGALTGDLVKSFFKRRMSISPGKPWPFFDQVDFIAGAIVFIFPVRIFSLSRIIFIVSISIITHMIASLLGYMLKLKN